MTTPATLGAEVLRRAADVLEARVEELSLLIIRGVAKPIAESRAEARRAVTVLRSGVVAVNRPTTGLDARVPFGGVRASGARPRQQGPDALDFYTEERTVYWREAAP
jgi:aldehyde dehydrogenase (NAD+)